MENNIQKKKEDFFHDSSSTMNCFFKLESSLKKEFMVDENEVPSPFKYREPMEGKIEKKQDLEDFIKDDDLSKKKPFNFMLWSTIKGYAGSSTIHGFSYLVEDGRSIFEK